MRHWLVLAGLALASGCERTPTGEIVRDDNVGAAALSATVSATTTSLPAGEYELPVSGAPSARLIVPASAASKCPVPLLVMLHGAGGTPMQIEIVVAAAKELGIVALVPFSRDRTWDIVLDGFGADVRNIDASINEATKRTCVDKQHLALAGFSDGASSALSLGIANGGLFTHVIAFSPGFLVDPGHRGKPLFYIAHAADDGILPFTNAQNLMVPYLEKQGYSVTLDVFVGGHTVLPEVAYNALTWFVSTR
jgi:phospholipase/carboxylesterase